MSFRGKGVTRMSIGPRPGHIRDESGASGKTAGANARFVDEETLSWLLLPREEFGLEAKDCVGVEIFGDSMEPLLPDGCLVLIDTNDKTLRKDGIYALRGTDGECAVKHVETIGPNRIALIPANRGEFRVEILELAAGESVGERIIGRVAWRAHHLKKGAGGKPPGG